MLPLLTFDPDGIGAFAVGFKPKRVKAGCQVAGIQLDLGKTRAVNTAFDDAACKVKGGVGFLEPFA